jgi:hypothetical protein
MTSTAAQFNPYGTDRGTGRTTRQMEAAKPKAIFVCADHGCRRSRDLARKCGREDLELVAPSTLDWPNRFAGREISEIVVDHAVVLTAQQRETLHLLGHDRQEAH